MKEPVDELDIGDPFDHFAKQAFSNAKRFGLPSSFINESIAIVMGAFGEDWLRTMFVKDRSSTPVIPASRHPLADCFAIAGKNQIAEILEIAVYLKHLAQVKNVNHVITQMKDKYYSGFLQLAYAYRFSKIGARNIELEPKTNKGKRGDIYFEFNNFPCIVECYIPHTSKLDTSIELYHSFGAIFDALISKDGIYRVSIKLKKSINSRDRKLIQSKIIGLINIMHGEEPVETEDEIANILIENISKADVEADFPTSPNHWTVYGDADLCAHQYWTDRAGIQAIRDDLEKHRRRGNRIFVWRPPSEKKKILLQERVDVLVKKMSKKLAQIKPVDEQTKRLIVVSVGEGKHERDDDIRISQEVGRKISIDHSNLFMIILTSRVWTKQNRHRYVSVILYSRGIDYYSSKELFEKLSEFEEKYDLFQEC